MASRSGRSDERKAQIEKRRIADRRASVRASGSRGRRATDVDPGARTAGAAAERSGTVRKRRSTRDGREPLVVYLRPESIKALKMAALENDTTVSAIVADQADAWLRANRRAGR